MIRYFSKRHQHSKRFDNYDEDINIVNVYKYHDRLTLGHKRRYTEKEIIERGYDRNDLPIVWHSFKVNELNRNDLPEIFKRIKTKFRYEHEWVEFRKDIKYALYSDMSKDWSTVLPDNITLWASRRLNELSRDESCVDNYRVAKVGNTCQERRYRRQKNRGCCGFYDIVDLCPIDGKSYRLGFNYGH
jgi:hypothetical protein